MSGDFFFVYQDLQGGGGEVLPAASGRGVRAAGEYPMIHRTCPRSHPLAPNKELSNPPPPTVNSAEDETFCSVCQVPCPQLQVAKEKAKA